MGWRGRTQVSERLVGGLEQGEEGSGCQGRLDILTPLLSTVSMAGVRVRYYELPDYKTRGWQLGGHGEILLCGRGWCDVSVYYDHFVLVRTPPW